MVPRSDPLDLSGMRGVKLGPSETTLGMSGVTAFMNYESLKTVTSLLGDTHLL